jgi:hypothetical protein
MRVIGNRRGTDARCIDHVDYDPNTGDDVHTGETLVCTYCGDTWQADTVDAEPVSVATGCETCEGVWVKGRTETLHLFPVNARGRKGYRKSGACHGERPRAMWDVYDNSRTEALARIMRSIA